MILAHRGVHRDRPENTLAAFEEAARLGLAGVETDVRRSRDGALVLFHDRLAPGGAPVAALDRAEIAAAAGYAVPTLAEALEAFPDLFFDVEVKDPEAGREVLDLLVRMRRTERIVVTSFRHDLVAALAPGSPVALGPILSHRPADAAAFAASWQRHPAVRILAVLVTMLDVGLARAAADAGLDVWAWGMLTRGEHQQARSHGASVLVTDYPEYAE